MKKSIFYLTLCVFIVSCSNTSQPEKDLREVINKKLNIEISNKIMHRDSLVSIQELREKHSHLSVIYLKDGCQPCYPKFVEWHQKMEEFKRNSGHSVLFIIQTKDYESFINNVRLLGEEIDEKYFIIIDPDFQFVINNSEIPDWIINSSMLIDYENKIKMVGAPWLNQDMTELFYKIINEQKTY